LGLVPDAQSNFWGSLNSLDAILSFFVGIWESFASI